MQEKIKLKINGQEIEAKPGSTILELVRENELDDIPTLCHADDLEPYGSCFVCVVEIKGKRNLVPSCATKAAPGMEIETRNDKVMAARKMAFELLCSNHYADCVSPCMEGCPAGVDAQGYIALSAMGEPVKAVDLIREVNPLPAICGRVCVRKCEAVCRRQDVDESVAINNVKRYVTDIPGIYDKDPERKPDTGKSVGIIGSGPAGLTAAWFLGKAGHKPVIYEAMERSGGMLRYGIPEYRLTGELLDAEVEYIERAGAEIKYNTRVGKDVRLDELRGEHDAVFIATGAWRGKPMRVEGEDDTEGVIRGAEFLIEKTGNPEPLSGTVVVVGGGNTAMDVARTSWRLGADKVIILYRRTKAEMPADEMEIEDCLEEGIEIMELAAPVGIIKDDGGKLKALRCIRMRLGEPDDSGRRRPIPMEGSEFDLPCDLAVPAIGQSPIIEGLTKADSDEVELTRWNTFVVDTGTMKTNVEGVFAGGDTADDGPTVVIDAIRDGQRAAKAIHSHITGEPLPGKDFRIEKGFWADPGKQELGEVRESPRHGLQMIDVEERKGNFDEVATGFDYEDNVHECERCLSCGCLRYYDCELRLRAEEYGVDMNEFKGYARKHKVDERHPHIVYDPNKCVLCAKCVRTCDKVLPISALGLVNRGFRTEMRPAMNDALVDTSCVGCGSCVAACPTGALTVKYPFPGRSPFITQDDKSYCGFCSLTCPVKVRKVSNNRYFIEPSDEPGEYLCRYGRFGSEIFIKKDRIGEPEVRTIEGSRKTSLDEAAEAAVKGLKDAAERHGAGKVAVFVSPDLTNEELYLASRIAREGIGTNNIASLSMLAGGREAGALDKAFGFTGSTADRGCLDDADLVICNNTALESDHLILSMKVIEAVKKRGAKFIVSNSTLNNTDRVLSNLAMDPMRGRAALLWKGVIDVMAEHAVFGKDFIKEIEKLDDYDKGDTFDMENISGLTGVEADDIRKAADIIAAAQNVVIIHSPDRPQDSAEGDLEILANLTTLLRQSGKSAELLLPQNASNSVGVELMGADPVFAPGRAPAGGGAEISGGPEGAEGEAEGSGSGAEGAARRTEGADSRGALAALLKAGDIKAALVLGEDPMSWMEAESWLSGVEFLAAMDWTPTETTRMAAVVLPGSTYLETEGTRVNFEGRLIEYGRVIEPPECVSGRDSLEALAGAMDLEVAEDLTADIAALMKEKLNEKVLPYYWNTGEERPAPPKQKLIKAHIGTKPASIPPPLTQQRKYKHELSSVGIKRYKVI